MAMALRAGFFEGPRFFYGGLCLTQTGGHGDFRLSSQPTDFCACGVEHSMLAVRADGVDECIKAAREELRKGASHIKIMASGGVLSPEQTHLNAANIPKQKSVPSWTNAQDVGPMCALTATRPRRFVAVLNLGFAPLNMAR